MQTAQRGDATDLKLREVWNASAPPKNYLLPALEVGSFQFLLNRFDNRFIGKDYDVSFQSIRRNLRTKQVRKTFLTACVSTKNASTTRRRSTTPLDSTSRPHVL